MVFRRWLLIVQALLLIKCSWADVTFKPPPVTTSGPQGNTTRPFRPFIEFSREGDLADKFVMDGEEFILVNIKMNYRKASTHCALRYNSTLAILSNFSTAKYMAEAMSETRLFMDTVWVAGRKSSRTHVWYWDRANNSSKIDDAILSLFVTTEIANETRECLGFGRSNYDDPQFRPLDCEAKRAYLCQHTKEIEQPTESTHRSWIKINDTLYKILADKVPYNVAAKRCYAMNSDSNLAVVPDFRTAQQLGRHLLIGRPSLENAWIGARWKNDLRLYAFESEDILLANTSVKNYPPWRNNTIQKTNGCILLDRHLANISLFVEANCNRERAVICYKRVHPTAKDHNDVIIKKDGYRIHFNAIPWRESVTYCRDNYPGKGGRLVEIKAKHDVDNLMFIMSEEKIPLQHIWLGGKFNFYSSSWSWHSDNSDVNPNLVQLVQNQSYDAVAEGQNTCLNMDRENHLMPLFYGTSCLFSQNFICHFTKKNLEQIQKEEASNISKIIV